MKGLLEKAKQADFVPTEDQKVFDCVIIGFLYNNWFTIRAVRYEMSARQVENGEGQTAGRRRNQESGYLSGPK